MTSEPEPVLYRVRTDLEYSTQTHQGQSVVVVKDPVTDRYFRFSGSQLTILELLAEPADLDTLARSASAKLGTDIPPATLARFLDSLRDKSLLEDPDTRSALAGWSRPSERNWLYLKLVTLNTQAVFDRLAPKVTWCFTPAFHAAAVLIISTGVVITAIHARSLVDEALSLLTFWGIVLIWCSVVSVGILHELAHGLTCRHFGGKVKEIGFMLIYFQPAFYCDVSDSWMLPSRRERMWVTAAGGYFQLVVWGLAAIVWRIFAEDTLINWIAMSVLVFAGLQTLVNFNPLIKLDGYYMLSDYLEIPNLRAKALQAVRSWIGGTRDPLLASSRRRALLTFGTLSLTFSTLLLVVIYVNIYLLATSYFAFAGFTAFVVFAGFTFKRTGAETAAGAGALVKRASLKKYRNLAIAGILLLLTFVGKWPLRLPADFTVKAGQEFQVRAPMDGMIQEIAVDEGQKVHRGQVVAYLYNADLERQFTALNGQKTNRIAELKQLEAGPRQQEIDQAEQRVETARQELENVERNVNARQARVRGLGAIQAQIDAAQFELNSLEQGFDEQLFSELQVQQAKAKLTELQERYEEAQANLQEFDDATAREKAIAEDRLEEARRDLALLNAGAREDEIERVRAEVTNLVAQVMQLGDELRQREVKAELTGIVVTPDLDQLEGDTVAAGTHLMTIQTTDTVTAELLVAEKDIGDVETGQPITLIAQAYPDRRFEGVVERMAETATTVNDDRYVRVTAQLQNEDGALRPDMTGHAKVNAGSRPIIKLATRKLVRWVRTDLWHLMP
jgi:putative peptide zinc metalloprotease protein